MPHLLELFSGTGSIGRVFAREGWDVTSVDLDPKAEPTILGDLLTLDLERLPPHVDAVWASPPCTHYSAARTTAKTPRDLEGSDALVRRTLEVIRRYPDGTPYWIENPWTGLLKTRDVLAGHPHAVVSYCMYAPAEWPKYQKLTGLWTNTLDWWTPRPPCRHGRRCLWYDAEAGRHPDVAQRVARGGHRGWPREILYGIPPALPADILRDWRRRYQGGA